jgi:hypothetical protein
LSARTVGLADSGRSIELAARIHAIVRRSKGHAQSVSQTGELSVNLDTKTVEVSSARVHLTREEYQMLEQLSLRKDMPLSREMFLNHLYGGMDEPEVKTIDGFICKLGKKLANASNGRNSSRRSGAAVMCCAILSRARRLLRPNAGSAILYLLRLRKINIAHSFSVLTAFQHGCR